MFFSSIEQGLERDKLITFVMDMVLTIPVLFYSILFLIYVGNMIRKSKIPVVNNNTNVQSSKELQIAKENLTRDKMIFAVLLFETLYRILEVADIVVLISKEGSNSEFPLTANCSLQGGTSLAIFYLWGWPYFGLVGINYACNVLVLSLLCILSIYMINIYITYLSPTKLKYYALYTSIKCLLIPTLLLMPRVFLLGNILYVVVFTVDYILYLILTKKLHQILKRKCIEVKYHGSEEEVKELWILEKTVKKFKIFSSILIFGYGANILGQMAEGLVRSIIGSLLLNPCWFNVTYGLHFSFSFAKYQLETAISIAVYSQFIGGSLLNISLLIVYSVYTWEQIKRKYKRARAYRFQMMDSLSVSLLNKSS